MIDELGDARLGIGFMLLWDIRRPDWGFFGYLGSSTSAWSYDPSTGDVVYNTKSIQGGLPTVADGHSGVVSIRLELPRDAAGSQPPEPPPSEKPPPFEPDYDISLCSKDLRILGA